MSKSFKNHEDARFMIGNEVPDNDVNIMYYEVPQLTPEKSLNALYNINLLPELEENSLGFTKKLYTNPDGILYDDTCSHYIVNSKDFTITDVVKGTDDEPVYYKYDLRYLHKSETGNIKEDITIYLNDIIYEKNDYYIEYSEVDNNLYQITIYADYKDNDFDMYSIEYHPNDIDISNYKEIINFEPIYKRVYNNNPGDNEYYLTEEEGTNYIITNYPASTTEQSYHDSTKTGYADTEFDYENILEGYKASEGKGVYVYFLIDSSRSMNSTNGFAFWDYRGYKISIELSNYILNHINNDTPANWDINYHFTFFRETITEDYPSQNDWYTLNELTDISSIHPDRKGINPNYSKFINHSIDQLLATRTEREGHKTIFIFMSDGRADKVSESEMNNLQTKLFESEVNHIWSFIIGPQGNFTSWGGYDDSHVDLMQSLIEGTSKGDFAEVDRDRALTEEEARDEFINSNAMPQLYSQVLQNGTAIADGAFCNTEWEQFIQTDRNLPGESFHPVNLTFKGNISGPTCLNKDYYFGYEDIPNTLDLTTDYITYEEV